MSLKDPVAVSGVMLRSIGNALLVEVEVCGQWVRVIEEHVADVGGAISHIVEPLGIRNAVAAAEEENDAD